MSVYERVYTDEQDVVLFWKTHMLYYVKTDRLFRDLSVEVDGRKFFFDCTALTHKKANEKRELVFALDKVEGEGTVRLVVSYSERGKITKTDDILKALKKAGHSVKEATFDKATRVFARQSEVDFFINKDARGFLSEQLDLWMFQYLFKDETQWNEKRIQQLQTIKSIAQKLIAFIAQFEDELVRVWNKPKFVRGTHYIITLDRIAAREGGTALIADFLKHEGMKAQITEWQELGIVAEGFDAKGILEGKGKDRTLATAWRSLPLDTLHFKSLELPMLALFDDLDNQLDGRLIKSENYQALNTLKDKFKGRVKRVFAATSWKKGKPVALNGPGLFCKVSTLEQYEEAISSAVYQDEAPDFFRNTKTNPYARYVFFRDMKQARALELDYVRDEVNVHLDRLYPDIDLAETLSCVTGKWIKRITAEEVEFADGSKQSLAKPDWELIKPLIFWGPVV